MPVHFDKPPRRFQDLVVTWAGRLCRNAQDALSQHDVLALVDRLEARLDDVIRPLVEIDGESLDSYHGAVVNALNEAARCKREPER
jgi:hypothetical protein